jgi:hypothetical protein
VWIQPFWKWLNCLEQFGDRIQQVEVWLNVETHLVKVSFSLGPPTLSTRLSALAGCEVDGAHVVATDQDGKPAIMVNAFGKGKLSCAPILESCLASKPSAFED